MLVQGVKKLNVLVVFLGLRSVYNFSVIIISMQWVLVFYFINSEVLFIAIHPPYILYSKFHLYVVESGNFSAVCCMIFMLSVNDALCQWAL